MKHGANRLLQVSNNYQRRGHPAAFTSGATRVSAVENRVTFSACGAHGKIREVLNREFLSESGDTN